MPHRRRRSSPRTRPPCTGSTSVGNSSSSITPRPPSTARRPTARRRSPPRVPATARVRRGWPRPTGERRSWRRAAAAESTPSSRLLASVRRSPVGAATRGLADGRPDRRAGRLARQRRSAAASWSSRPSRTAHVPLQPEPRAHAALRRRRRTSAASAACDLVGPAGAEVAAADHAPTARRPGCPARGGVSARADLVARAQVAPGTTGRRRRARPRATRPGAGPPRRRATEPPQEWPTTTARDQPERSRAATTSSAQAATEKSASSGGVGLPVAALVEGGDRPRAQAADDRTPEVPLLAQAVQQEHRGRRQCRVARGPSATSSTPGRRTATSRRRPSWRHRSACRRRAARIGRLAHHGRSHGARLIPRTAAARCARPCPKRVVVADGAMGTMLQAADPTLDDFEGYEGCNEILNVTRPDVVAQRPRRLLRGRRRLRRDQHLRRQPGQPRRVRHRRPDLRARRGRRRGSPARSADGWSTPGPPALGARLGRARAPSCPASATRRTPSCATPTSSRSPGWSPAAPTRSSIETAQDLLQAKAAIIGARRALTRGRRATCRSSPRSPSRPPARCCSAPRSAPR